MKVEDLISVKERLSAVKKEDIDEVIDMDCMEDHVENHMINVPSNIVLAEDDVVDLVKDAEVVTHGYFRSVKEYIAKNIPEMSGKYDIVKDNAVLFSFTTA